MARLDALLPPGEFVRWRSPARNSAWPIFAWGLLAGGGIGWLSSMQHDATGSSILLFAAVGMAGTGIFIAIIAGLKYSATAKLAVTEAHIVWVDNSGAASSGRLALREIVSMDAEEGSSTLTIYQDGGPYRIEALDGCVESAALAAGRPARICRECKSAGALQAARWRLYVGMAASGLAAAAMIGLLYLILGDVAFKGLRGAVLIAISGLIGQWFGSMAKLTLPHVIVRQRLRGEARRDFVSWMTDLRWRGIKPDGPNDERLPHSRLQDWAMRLAYGKIPQIGEREPEIIIPGKFPQE